MCIGLGVWLLIMFLRPPPAIGGGESHLLSSPTLKAEGVVVPSTEAGERQTSDYSPPLWPWTSLTLGLLT